MTGSPIDGAEEAEEDLNDLVARKNFLRMQDWEYNNSVLDRLLSKAVILVLSVFSKASTSAFVYTWLFV